MQFSTNEVFRLMCSVAVYDWGFVVLKLSIFYVAIITLFDIAKKCSCNNCLHCCKINLASVLTRLMLPVETTISTH